MNTGSPGRGGHRPLTRWSPTPAPHRTHHKKGARPGRPSEDDQPGLTPIHTLKCRRRPTLPHPPRCSTIGAGRLSFRVRKGTGRDPTAKTTDKTHETTHTQPPQQRQPVRRAIPDTAQWTQTRFNNQHNNAKTLCSAALGQLVPVTSNTHMLSRSGLSTP